MRACHVLVSVIFLFSNSCFAIACEPAEKPLSASFYVAAPEMLSLAASQSSCISVRQVMDAVVAKTVIPTTTTNTSAAGYVPKTKDDNTPWRFDMNQNGRRMTSEEFDAWMKAKGIHVATGKAQTAVNAKAQD